MRLARGSRGEWAEVVIGKLAVGIHEVRLHMLTAVPHVHGQERGGKRSIPKGCSRLEPLRIGHRIRATLEPKLILRKGVVRAVGVGRIEC